MKYSMTLNDLKRITGLSAPVLRERLARQFDIRIPTSDKRVSPRAVRTLLASMGVNYTSKVIAFVNLKGGVGKTVSAINFASRATQYGWKTCLLDMDSQGSASLAFDCEPAEDDPIFYDVWQKPEKMVMVALRQIDDQFFILPSSLDNALLDSSLANPAAEKEAVRGVCEELKRHDFDLVVIDCPPSLGTAVISTISAADILVIPLANDPYSAKGLALTLNESRSIRKTFGLEEPIVRILMTRYDKRERLTGEALEYLKKKHCDLLLPVVIPTSTRYAQALARHETVFAPGDYREAKESYDHLTRHLLEINPNRKRR